MKLKHYLMKLLEQNNCGNLIRPNYVTETFLKLLKKKKLKIIRFHDLRHTCASILLKNGANMK